MVQRTSVTLSNNQFSAFEFTQDLARTKSHDFDAFFVADLGKLRLLVEQWSASLPRVRPFYSINCNADEHLLRILASFPQIGFHCLTRQNMENALDFVGPERLSYSNPCWTNKTLLAVRSNDVALLGFDSERDLTRMAACGLTNKLILNVCADAQLGEDTVVGCEVSRAPELLRLAADLGLDCVGIGFNLGGQRPALFESMIECAARLFEVGRSFGLAMKVLSLGGGFPSILSPHTPSFEALCQQINASLDYFFPASHDVQVIATPGRFFASSVFSLATKIVDKFEVDASDITKDDFDAGQKAYIYRINQGYFGAFGCRVMPNCEPKCLPLFAELANEECQSAETFVGSVLGPHMNNDEDLDVVQETCKFRQMGVDEWLVWPNMGAYSMNNCASLDDDDECDTPAVYYFSKEKDWKFMDYRAAVDVPTAFVDEDTDVFSDGESTSSDDSGVYIEETIQDLLWIFDSLV